MAIILNEKAYVERLIREKDLGASPVKTIGLVARYYRSLGYKPKKIREEIEHFLLRCDPDINLVKWSNNIEKAVNRSKNKPLCEIDSIPITQNEIDTCKQAGTSAYQRVLFSMLCLAKFHYIASGHEGGWVNSSMRDIFSLANVKTAKKRQAFMVGKLSDTGLIQLSRRIDSTNMQITFIDICGEPVLEIDELRDLGFKYERYLYGEKDYPQCEICGKIVRRTQGANRTRRYCPSCAKEMILKRGRGEPCS